MSQPIATYYVTIQGMPDEEYKVEILEDGALKKVLVNGQEYVVDYNVGGDTIHSIIMNHRSYGVQLSAAGTDQYEVKHMSDSFHVHVIDEMKKMRQVQARTEATGRQVITAQMPGVIQQVAVTQGQAVEAGDLLCVLVAMKMENEIHSPITGTVREVYVHDADKVTVGDKLLVVE
jgi:biotin carboxyl carrier protein